MTALMTRFGARVAAHRKANGLTQKQLAVAAHMSHFMISRIEAGGTGVRFASIEKLSDALNVDPAQLFTHELDHNIAMDAALRALIARLLSLPQKKLIWLTGLIDAAMKAN
jgi:transcriptional regulator with XRE-family HTH domain